MKKQLHNYPALRMLPVIVSVVLLIASCRSQQISENARANIHLPLETVTGEASKIKADDSPSVITLTDENGKKTVHARIERDRNGNAQLSVHLKEVTVTAKMKSIPERFGKVGVDFIVSVPEELINSRWQLNLTPHLIKGGTVSDMEDLVISGKDFGQRQQKQYGKYARYLSGIVPDSLFDRYFVRDKAYQRYITRYNRKELRRVYRDSVAITGYLQYIGRINRRYALFNEKMYRNRAWLAKVMNVPGIKQRFVCFQRDTTYVAGIYDKRFRQLVHLLPEFHLLRDMTCECILWKYRDGKYKSGFVNDYQPVSLADSVAIKKLFLRHKRIARNHKLIEGKEQAFERMIQFPRNDKAKLDTVIYTKGHFEYHYSQEVTADENSRQMKVYLDGYARSLKGGNKMLPHSDTLNFTVSSMVQFLDTTPRYITKVVERKVTSSLRANITFHVGKSAVDITLGNNRTEIDKVQQMTGQLTRTGEFIMDSISISAGCSPEGGFRYNAGLSKLRAEAIRNYLAKSLPDMEGDVGKMLHSYSKGEDWKGLELLVSDSLKGTSQRAILDMIAAPGDPDRKETVIRQKFPEDYAMIREQFYPKLRAVDFTFHVHRKGMVKDTIHTLEPDTVYARGIVLMYQRKYRTALTVLSEYNDYNTAICLMSLGYNQTAYTLLETQPVSANSEYLLAVLASREGNTQEAIKRYLHAVKLDPSKRFRGTLDPEINKLIRAYGLNKDVQ